MTSLESLVLQSEEKKASILPKNIKRIIFQLQNLFSNDSFYNFIGATSEREKEFVNVYKDVYRPNIHRDKLRFHPDSIEFDGLKVSKKPLSYETVKNVEWIILDENTKVENGHTYFNFDGVKVLSNAGYEVLSTEQLAHILTVIEYHQVGAYVMSLNALHLLLSPHYPIQKPPYSSLMIWLAPENNSDKAKCLNLEHRENKWRNGWVWGEQETSKQSFAPVATIIH